MSFAFTAADIISAGEQNLIHSRASAAEGGPTAQRVRDGGTSTLALCGRNNEPKMKHSHQNAERRGKQALLPSSLYSLALLTAVQVLVLRIRATASVV